MKLKIRSFLGNFYFIHFEVFLALFAFFGYLIIHNQALVFFTLLSFAGALCGAFIRVIDAIQSSSK
ncbi:MAG: hypothetical protein NT165_00275 [Candidatus Falkowbacteria bacterium]|nr:hypothetical protein [Candidatus Falkowbacteria bacterium]